MTETWDVDANLVRDGVGIEGGSLSRSSAAVSESSCAMLASRTQKTTCKRCGLEKNHGKTMGKPWENGGLISGNHDKLGNPLRIFEYGYLNGKNIYE